MAVQKLHGVTSMEASLVHLCSMEAQLVPNFHVPIFNCKIFVFNLGITLLLMLARREYIIIKLSGKC